MRRKREGERGKGFASVAPPTLSTHSSFPHCPLFLPSLSLLPPPSCSTGAKGKGFKAPRIDFVDLEKKYDNSSWVLFESVLVPQDRWGSREGHWVCA